MSDLWQFFIANWLIIFWGWIIAAFAASALWAAVHEIYFRVTRRRYQAARE
jgi:hypothetical protein